VGFMPFPKLFVWPNILIVILAMFSAGLTKSSVKLLAAQPEGCGTACYAAAITTLASIGGFVVAVGVDLLLFRRRFRVVTFIKEPRVARPADVTDPCLWIYAHIRVLCLGLRLMLKRSKQAANAAVDAIEEAKDAVQYLVGASHPSREETASVVIQKEWRRHKTAGVEEIKAEKRATTILQALFRRKQARRMWGLALRHRREFIAARSIQATWRGHAVAPLTQLPPSPPPSPAPATGTRSGTGSPPHRDRVPAPPASPERLAAWDLDPSINGVANRAGRSGPSALQRQRSLKAARSTAQELIARGSGLSTRASGAFKVPTDGMAEPERTERILRAPFTLCHRVPGDAFQARVGFQLFRVNALSPIGYMWRFVVLCVNVSIGVLGGLTPLIAPKGPTSAEALAQIITILGLQLAMAMVCFFVCPDADKVFSYFAGAQFLAEAAGTACRLWAVLLPDDQLLGDTLQLGFTLALVAMAIPITQMAEAKLFKPFVTILRTHHCSPVQILSSLLVVLLAIPRKIQAVCEMLAGQSPSSSSNDGVDEEKAILAATSLVTKTLAGGNLKRVQTVKRAAPRDPTAIRTSADDDGDGGGGDGGDGGDDDGGDDDCGDDDGGGD